MLLAEQYETIDHTTGATYGRSSQLDYHRRQHRVQDLTRRTEPWATLGDSLAVCRSLISGSAAVGRTFDVGAFEAENHLLIEVDAPGRPLDLFVSRWQLEAHELPPPRPGWRIEGAFLFTGRVSGGLGPQRHRTSAGH